MYWRYMEMRFKNIRRGSIRETFIDAKVKKRFYWRKFFVVIGLIIFFVNIGRIGGDNNSTSPSTTSKGDTQQVAQKGISRMNEEVTVGNFTYEVVGASYKESLGDEYFGKEADGIYLVVALKFRNNDNVEHDLSDILFKVIDEQKNQYEYSSEASMYLGEKGMMFLKGCNPGIWKKGLLVFEVPKRANYYIGLSGGFKSDDVTFVKLSQ